MALALYNTLTRTVEPFAPLAPPRVTLYTCGPTVWNYAHIGNFRTFLFEDLLRRYLEALDYQVFHIMNLTDVDDRTITAARAADRSLREHVQPFVDAFFEDRDYLRIRPAHVYPRATEYVAPMIALVGRLLERDLAYRGDDGSVYFAIAKFPPYGRLSQLDRRTLRIGARVASDEYAKEDPRDFALWKRAAAEDEQVGAAWDAPFGRGRPGWHLECSAMALHEIRTRFGVETLDIHAGGVDLVFPHHEDEIAQSEGSTGQPFARHWLHGAFLNVKGTKMSKRSDNFLTARDLQANGVDPATLRYLVYSTHYRQPLDYTDEALQAAAEGARRLAELRARLAAPADAGGTAGAEGDARLEALAARLGTDVGAALDDDLNSPVALAALFEFVRAANRELDRGVVGAGGRGAAAAALDRWVGVFDILPAVKASGTVPLTGTVRAPTLVLRGALPADPDPAFRAWVEERIVARAQARNSKNFNEADRIRDELRARSVELEDGASGTRWRLI